MFESSKPEGFFRKWGRRAFIVPVAVTFCLLLRVRDSTIYVSYDPFTIGNYLPSKLPGFAAEIVSYDYYIATALALVLASVAALHARRAHSVSVQSVWYLPAYAAGIEAVRYAGLLGSRHSFSGPAPAFAEIQASWTVAAMASLTVVFFAVGVGHLLSRIAQARGSFPPSVVGLVLSVAAAWCAVLSLVWMTLPTELSR